MDYDETQTECNGILFKNVIEYLLNVLEKSENQKNHLYTECQCIQDVLTRRSVKSSTSIHQLEKDMSPNNMQPTCTNIEYKDNSRLTDAKSIYIENSVKQFNSKNFKPTIKKSLMMTNTVRTSKLKEENVHCSTKTSPANKTNNIVERNKQIASIYMPNGQKDKPRRSFSKPVLPLKPGSTLVKSSTGLTPTKNGSTNQKTSSKSVLPLKPGSTFIKSSSESTPTKNGNTNQKITTMASICPTTARLSINHHNKVSAVKRNEIPIILKSKFMTFTEALCSSSFKCSKDLISFFEFHQKLQTEASIHKDNRKHSASFLTKLKERNKYTTLCAENSFEEYRKWMRMKMRCSAKFDFRNETIPFFKRETYQSVADIATFNMFSCDKSQWEQLILEMHRTEFLFLQLGLLKVLNEDICNQDQNMFNSLLFFRACKTLYNISPLKMV